MEPQTICARDSLLIEQEDFKHLKGTTLFRKAAKAEINVIQQIA